MAQTDVLSTGQEVPQEVPDSPAAAPAKKARRQLPQSMKRILVIVAGVFGMVASIGGFYYVSDAFDQKVPVLVAATDIAAGETIGAQSLTSASVVIGSIPHVPWTPRGAVRP